MNSTALEIEKRIAEVINSGETVISPITFDESLLREHVKITQTPHACPCGDSCGSNYSRNGSCPCSTSCGTNYSRG